MRRLRASFASSHPGGTGAPPEATKSLCQELADTEGTRAGDVLSPRRNVRSKARPDVEQTLPMVRREAAARRKSRSITRTDLRLSAHRRPSRICRAHSRRGNDHTWLFERLDRCTISLLLRRLRCFRQVVERGDDVFGERIGQCRAFVRIAHETDAAIRQFRKAIR